MRLVSDPKEEKKFQNLVHQGHIMIGALIVVGLSSLYIAQVPSYVAKARLVELYIFFPTIREKIMTDYSYMGHWPTERNFEASVFGMNRYVSKISFDGKGTINMYISESLPELSGKIVSFVANVSTAAQSNRIIWSCGYALPLKGFVPMGRNNTTVNPKYLPKVCRDFNLNNNK